MAKIRTTQSSLGLKQVKLFSYLFQYQLNYFLQLVSDSSMHNIMKTNKQPQQLNKIRKDSFINIHYQILTVLGQGSFGKILKAVNKNTLETIALKMENISKTKEKFALKNEAYILRKLQNKPGIPKLYNQGQTKNWAYIELQLLEHDLALEKQYTTHDITELFLEILSLLEVIHNQNVVHQDLKPQNIMRSKQNKLFLIDYGLSKILATQKIQKIRGFVGTPRYASIRAHNMEQLNKRDDIQSAFYVIAFLYYKRLPWCKLKVPQNQKMERIKTLKMTYKKTLFENMPSQFQKAFEYINELDSQDEPNYNILKGFFKRHRTLDFNTFSPILEKKQRKHFRSTFIGSNLLQIPEHPFANRHKAFKQGLEEMSTQLNKSRSNDANRSDMIMTELLQMGDDLQDQKQNINETEQQEVSLHNCSSIVQRSLRMKNPFK